MKLYSIIVAAVLFVALTGMRGDTQKEVNLLLEGTFTVNPELPNGGVFVMRGEGSNAVITINLPMPPPEDAITEPVDLTFENISYLDVHVTDEGGREHVLKSEDIESAAYVIEFTYMWDNGVEQQYRVRNNYDGDY
jgi:hypothetical protein